MWPFHRHRWVPLTASVLPPRSNGLAPTSEFVHGATVLSLRCRCGALRTKRLLGSHPALLAGIGHAEIAGLPTTKKGGR